MTYIGLNSGKGPAEGAYEAMKRLGVPLLVAVFAASACWPFSGDEVLAAMTLRREAGQVKILRAGEQITVRDTDVSVQPGDVIQTFKSGLAQVALEAGRTAWIAGSSAVITGAPEAQARIIDSQSLEGETGTVLAEAKATMMVRFGDTIATGTDSLFRIDDRAGSSRAASYEGDLRLRSPGQANVTVERLFEVQATAGELRSPQPYQLDPDDVFDSQRLRSIIELDQTIGRLTAGLASQLGGQRPDYAYFKALSGAKNVSAIKQHLKRPTIELLTGYAIAANVDRIGFGTALEQAFTYRDDGGSWGVVAGIVGSDPKLLVSDLTDIIRGTGAVAGGAGDTPEFTVAAAVAAGTGGPPGGSDLGDGGSDPGDGPDEKEPKEDSEPPPEPKECTDTANCAKEDIEEAIFGEPSPSPTSILDI